MTKNTFSLFSRKKLLWLHKDESLSYARGKLYFADSSGEICLGTFLDSRWRLWASRIRILERILRLEPRVCVPLPDRAFLISARGSICRVDTAGRTIQKEHTYRPGMSSPLQICSAPGQPLVYGDYLVNPAKKAVSIFCRDSHGSWHPVYTFPDGTLNHIHGIVDDPYRDQWVILTGDTGESAGIWLADRSFSHVRPLVRGSQQYRTCVLIPVESGFLYATDSPNDQNYVFHLALDGDRVLSLQSLAELPGSCIYGLRAGDTMYFSTSVETDPEITGLRYLLSYRLGRGIASRESCILAVRQADGQYSASRIAAFQKDIWPMGLCQFGNVQFPLQQSPDRLFCCPIGVKKYDGKTVEIPVPAQRG